MATAYNQGQDGEFRYSFGFEKLPEQEKERIRKEIADPNTRYVKQEFEMPNWLAEWFQDKVLSKF
jgi:hypothetical protein